VLTCKLQLFLVYEKLLLDGLHDAMISHTYLSLLAAPSLLTLTLLMSFGANH